MRFRLPPALGASLEQASKGKWPGFISDAELLAVLTRLFLDGKFYQETKAKIAAVDFSDYETRQFIQRIQQVYKGVMER